MKKLALFLAAALLSLTAVAQKIVVTTPGTLPALVGEEKYTLKKLTLEGALNGTDLRCLREMMGSDYEQQPTEGKLVSLDLSLATFAKGGEAYIQKDGPQHVTGGPRTVPKFLLRKCRVEKIVLPAKAEKLDTGALEYSALRSVSVPDNCIIADWVFNEMPQLTNITFPDYTPTVGSNNFIQCPRLRRLRFGNMGYVGAQTLKNLSNVEEISFGNIGHIDGWYTIANCPNLRRVDFRGYVLSTGGAELFADNPKLSAVVFHKAVYYTYIGKAPDCPNLKCYDVRDWVFHSAFDPADTTLHLQQTTSDVIEANPKRYVMTLGAMEQVRQAPFFYGGNVREEEGVRYTKMFALAGRDEEAVSAFVKQVDKGIYEGWKRLKADTTTLQLLQQRVGRHPELALALDKLKKEESYLYVLRQATPYGTDSTAHPPFRYVTYTTEGDTTLRSIRTYFNLDSIAGDGDEISRIKNVMYWLHNQIPHDGQHGNPSGPQDAVSLYKVCKAENRGMNCRGLAKVLAQCYLAMGWPARFLTCQPRLYNQDNDCHVITMVWSRQLGKWVWMDPTMASFVTDENGLLLHPGEVRARLISGEPLVLNDDANWNHKEKQTKEDYLDNYMAKNLYLLSAHTVSSARTENGGDRDDIYMTLTPKGWSGFGSSKNLTCDPAYFWQAPEE